MELGRNWYDVTYIDTQPANSPASLDSLEDKDTPPPVIHILAKSRAQAEAIALHTYPILAHHLPLFVSLIGTERQFQEMHEPDGEVDLDLLPF